MSAVIFRFSGWAGWDFWRRYLPESWQARAAAKKLLRGNDFETGKGRLVVQMPMQSYEVVDAAGHVKPCAHEPLGGI